VAFAVLLWALAVVGTFRWNAALSAVSRLVTYAITCAALPVLRRKNIGRAGFHLAGGDGFAAVGLLFAVVIASRMGRAELITLAICAGLASLNWLALQRHALADATK
jgi:amino acid transporter